jgi:hypothetical protein
MVVLVLSVTLLRADVADEFAQAEALQRAQRWAEARGAFEALLPKLEGERLADALNKIGYGYERDRRQHEQAIATHRRALAVPEATPSSRGYAWLRIGYSARGLGREQEAVEAFQRAASIEGITPQMAAEALLYLSWTYNSLADTEAAVATMRRILDMPGVSDAYRATAWSSIGHHAERARDWAAAQAAYRAILALGTGEKQISEAQSRLQAIDWLLQGDLPFFIRPYAVHVTTDGATVQWVSQGTPVPGEVVVGGKVFPAEVEALPDTECHLHRAVLTGFAPGARVAYDVRSGGHRHPGAFRTAPPPGTPVVFAATGDSQGPPILHQKVAAALAVHAPDFVLHVGDLTDKGADWIRWRTELFDPGAAYFTNAIFAPTIGNHDGGPYYPRLFGVRNRAYYSFTYGDVFVVSLASYGSDSSSSRRADQLQWLDEQLAGATARWKVINLHIPMVTTTAQASWFGLDDFQPLLEKHRVDLVVCGHHPIYRRYLPLGEPGQPPILHVTTGGAGGVGAPIPSPILSQGGDTQHFTVFTATPDRLEMFAGDGEGNRIDHTVLHKDAAGNPPADYIASSVPRLLAARIRHLYQDVLAPDSWELLLRVDSDPHAGEQWPLVLDLDRRPRGVFVSDGLPPQTFLRVSGAPGTPWRLPVTDLDLHQRRHILHVTPPEGATRHGQRLDPPIVLTLQLVVGERSFLPFTTQVLLETAAP